MANPFLMGDLDAGDTQVTSTTPSFNPFLSGTMDFSASESENPFMSTLSTEATSTNPFAFGGTDNASITTDFFSSSAPEFDKTQHHQTQSYENVFSSPVSNHTSNGISSDIFSGFIDQQPQYQPQTTFSAFGSARSSVDHTAFVNNNVSLFGCDPLSMTNSREGSGASTPKGAPPKRPPPPPGLPQRPGPPKETMNLILSVTGTMEATSSQMLDRLQATRTPSPTPMRDLNTPSPTPDMFGDLLGADDVPPIHTEPQQPVQEVNLLGDMEYDLVSSSTAMQPTQMVPIAPVPSSVSQVTPVIPTAKITSVAAPPPRPLPPRPGPPPERPAPPPERPSLPPERPVLPPERPKPPPTIPTDPSVQNNIIDWNEPKPQPIPKHTEVPTRYVSPSSEPHKSEDITSSLSTKLAFSEPSEEELDFSLAVSTGPSNEPTIIHGPVESTPFITSGFESSTQPTFDTPVFDSHVNEAALVAYPSQLTLTEPIDTSEPALPSTGFEAPESEATYTSQFDQQGNVEDSSFATGFASEMNISVVPASADNSIDSSVFGVTSTEMSDSFFSNTDVSFTAQSNDLFAPPETVLHTTPVVPTQPFNVFGDSGPQQADDFDAFTAKFESAGFEDNKNTSSGAFDPFSSSPFGAPKIEEDTSMGFGADDNFDSFLATQEPPPVPQSTPARLGRGGSADSDDSKDFNVFIKPAGERGLTPDFGGGVPSLAPPPKSPLNAFQDSSPRFNPFDKSQEVPAQLTDNIFAQAAVLPDEGDKPLERTDSQETPPTPLFDEDVSQPLEPFPRIHYTGLGWEMHLRHPNKKKITGQRFWKKVFIRLVYQGENPVLQLLNNKDDKDPFQELPLQPCYSVSDIGAQQFDQYGKIFTVKLQFIFYKERPGVRPGQVTKAERITNKLSQFAAYAIQGDYQGVKEFGSDLKKLGLPVEHAPQISQLFKIGSQSYEDMKQFSVCIEEALFRLPAHRDRALNYKMEEVQITAVDELYVDQNATGGIIRQIARVRLFFLGFLSGMPDVELGVNDMVRQGKEVVGRHDIIPVVTEEWIRLEAVEFHSCVQQDEYERTRTIKFKPPDASYIELMRFRVRPPRNRELPLQLRVQMCISGNKVDLNADVLVPGFSSRKLGQIPCEDVAVRIPIPECWIYLFRVEKHFRYGSVKSAHRRTGKVKGLERFLGTVENMEPQLMEATSGQAKYEHQHRAIVWRMPRLPKEGQGAYTTHNLVCHMALTSFDQIPEELEKFCYVEFTMPVTQVSHTTARSVSISDTDNDSPPEKYVRQLARHEYKVEIEFTQREGPNDYIAATKPVAPPPIAEEPPPRPPAAPDSDSDSSG